MSKHINVQLIAEVVSPYGPEELRPLIIELEVIYRRVVAERPIVPIDSVPSAPRCGTG
jgi:hypothetical protein